MSLLAVQMGDRIGQIIFWCLVLLGLLFVLCVGLWYYRRRVLGPVDKLEQAWTFQDIRDMRDRGELTEEEYQAIRQTMIGAYRDQQSDSPPAKSLGGFGQHRGALSQQELDDNFDLEKGPQP